MSGQSHFQLLETAAGVAAIGWNASGINSLRLPAPDAQDSERAIARHLPDAVRADPSPEVDVVIDAIRRYFAGQRVDFSDVPVDLGPQELFFTRVYDVVRQLGWGETATYGAIAQTLGAGPEYAREVGQAMASNPVPLIVPCHRVTAAGGKIGGFSAPGGSMSKARMLELEGVTIGPAPEVSPQHRFDF